MNSTLDSFDYFSTVTGILKLKFNDELLSHATGFIYKNENENENFLITNWHVVTGTHPITSQTLHKEGAKPDKLIFSYNSNGAVKELPIDLYKNHTAVWYEHPKHKEKVDVVAIPLDNLDNFSEINNLQHIQTDLVLKVGMEIYVLGYPSGINVKNTPIWKRASIASEPSIDVDDLPKILVDTATKEGLSGAPVILRPSTSLTFNGLLKTKFIGVYASRIPRYNDEDKKKLENGIFMAQLGEVYKEKVISEIISYRTTGQSQI